MKPIPIIENENPFVWDYVFYSPKEIIEYIDKNGAYPPGKFINGNWRYVKSQKAKINPILIPKPTLFERIINKIKAWKS